MFRGNITSQFFRLQPEYRGKRRIKVTVWNVSPPIWAYMAAWNKLPKQKDRAGRHTVNTLSSCASIGEDSTLFPISLNTVINQWCWSSMAGDHYVGLASSWYISLDAAFKKRPPQRLPLRPHLPIKRQRQATKEQHRKNSTNNSHNKRNWGPPQQRRRGGVDPRNSRKEKIPIKRIITILLMGIFSEEKK